MLTLFRNSSIDFEIRSSFETIIVIEILIRLLEAERYVKPEPFWDEEEKEEEKKQKKMKKKIRIRETTVEIHNYLL